jgi:hypothetical protein
VPHVPATWAIIAPSSADRARTLQERTSMQVEVTGILGLIHLILTIYAIVKIVGSSAGTGSKVLWIVIVLLLPVLGLILWFLFGPS